ncbi:disulfide bond formation protein DsbA [Streptomyces sp. NTH33]|uniref:DsbA family protein n=1 Tax=Streptomyces sp. NTH33 TaxID=1735453 RepID=UPI000DA9A8C1|nr:thioredoxin domain-containing protein [Streptomyces sp. NTH33]PZH21007.1 disulfide bond formation protein DsbA [Streptomyces sp. NTH33]
MGERRARRVLAAAAAAVLVGVLATGCGGRHAGAGDGKPDAPTAYKGVEEIPETLAPDGSTVRVGSPRAKIVVHVYEDMRCPLCEQFETQGGGEALREMVLSGEVRAEYTLASFLDDKLGGQGSKKAANALRAALEAGKFVEYHEALFAHQPEEAVDGYTDAFLLDRASQVPGLRGTDFDAAVKGMKHRDFVTASENAFQKSGVSGTPTLKVNGRAIPDHLSGGIFDKDMLPMVIGVTARP